ncbi:hypothetical protein HIM_01409 [Hirsutella minnesotensis 3608]|nr:hypothetical protein HIM_01409 [Hirsutella minnesotensis 3608]
MAATSAAGSLLRRQLKEMQACKDLPGISCGLVSEGNIFEWEVMLMINDDCKYYGGKSPSPPRDPAVSLPSSHYGTVSELTLIVLGNRLGGNFRAKMLFPPNYPHMPPSLTFQHPVPFHPNIYESGDLCISILHPPEEDVYGYEAASERWSPSPANVEAARMLREEREGKHKDFRKRCRKCVRESLGED